MFLKLDVGGETVRSAVLKNWRSAWKRAVINRPRLFDFLVQFLQLVEPPLPEPNIARRFIASRNTGLEVTVSARAFTIE
jgi:hypothetical protein